MTKATIMAVAVATLAAGVVVTLVTASDSRASRKAYRGARPENKGFSASGQTNPARGFWRVDVLPNARGDTRDQHTDLARILSRIDFVPPDRATHFQALDTPDYRLDGWHAFVESAESSPKGTLVSLRVSPRVSSSYGASTTVIGGVVERYLVTNGTVEFIDLTAPPGGAFHGVITD